jgi:hypothetical protein
MRPIGSSHCGELRFFVGSLVVLSSMLLASSDFAVLFRELAG